MIRHHPARALRLLAVACLAAVGLTAMPSSSIADGEGTGRFPGLPFVPCTDLGSSPCGYPDQTNDYGWQNAVQSGLVGSVPAKQWTRIPLTMVAAAVEATSFTVGGTGNDSIVRATAFFTSPKGSADNYGDSALVPVRTVAFGSIPVELTLQVSQRRGPDGLPVPITFQDLEQTRNSPRPGVGQELIVPPTKLEDHVTVWVRKLVVDGVDVGLSPGCRTAGDAHLKTASKELHVIAETGYVSTGDGGKSVDQFDPTQSEYGFYGGTFEGTLDIPAFASCPTTSGDDLAPLLTSAVSGPANPLRVQVGAASCTAYSEDDGRAIPIRPGVNEPTDPSAGCILPGPYHNPKIVTVPDPIPFPDHAPGS